MLPEIPWRKDEKRRGLLKKKGLACLVLRILRRAEVCLCHQLLDHPHKTFSVSSTASQSSGRSSWPTKRPSLRIQQDLIPGPGFSMGFFPAGNGWQKMALSKGCSAQGHVESPG